MTVDETILDILVSEGILSRKTADEIIAKAPSWKEKLSSTGGKVDPWLPEILEEMKVKDKNGRPLNEEEVMELIASHFKFPFRRIDPLDLDLAVVTETLPRPFASNKLIVPLDQKNGVLTVAVANPFDIGTLEDLKKVTGQDLAIVVSPRRDILKIINEFYGFRSSVEAAEKELTKGLDLGNLEHYLQVTPEAKLDSTDRHIVQAVDHLFRYALDQRASDIHIEPKRDYSQIRLRIDGVLHQVYNLPGKIHPAIISRIKSLAAMDIAEKRRPQDGRLKIAYRNREIEVRASTLPTAFGEKMVLRLFDPNILIQRLDNLGFFPQELSVVERFFNHAHGIILVTGPTGSGKTTTLYSILNRLATGERNIVTIEDPIEMIHPAFNQVNVNPAINLTFASALRTILRQDPDIIMVGEIRDPETASNAVQAALTGHLVLSTLHTNDAATAVVRLTDLGVPPFLISATLIGAMGQRLVRIVCTNCRREVDLEPGDLSPLGVDLPPGKTYRGAVGTGCHICRKTGFSGRTGIFEVLEITPAIRELITHQGSLQELISAARKNGMRTLLENGVKKIVTGLTTAEEVLRAVYT